MYSKKEITLVKHLKESDIKAFDFLYHRYSQNLYRFAFSMLKNEEDSKEVVQEVFFRIWKKRSEIDISKSFKSFLFTISYHLILDQLRLRLKDQDYRNFLKQYFVSNRATQTNSADIKTINKQVQFAISELPEKRKKIFVLSREEGLSNKEIANKLGVSIKTVENQINLSLKHIRIRLGKDILAVALIVSLLIFLS